MAKKAKSQSTPTSAQRQAASNVVIKDLAQSQSRGEDQSKTVAAAQEDLRDAFRASTQAAHPEGVGIKGDRAELPVSDQNPPADHSIQEPTMAAQHPAVTTPQGTRADSIGDAHDLRDINMRALIGWFGALVAMVAVASLLTFAIFKFNDSRNSYKDELPSPLMMAKKAGDPGEARPGHPLLPAPELPLQQYNREQRVFADEYSRDPRTGDIRIPIDEAMKLTAQRMSISRSTGSSEAALPGQAEMQTKENKDWRNPAYFIPPTELGIGKNDPQKDFRVPSANSEQPGGHLRELSKELPSANAGEGH